MKKNKTKKIRAFFYVLCLSMILICIPAFADDKIGKVGDIEYFDINTFASAIGGDKITVNGTTLTLTNDIDLGTFTSNKIIFYSDITINLAGHKLTGSVAGASSHLLYVDKEDITVTITDSEGGGHVKNITTGYCKVINVNKGTLVVDGAKIVGESNAEDSTSTTFDYPCVVLTDNSSKSTIILKNGAQICAEGANTPIVEATGIMQEKNSKLVMDNSKIDVKSGHSGYGIITAEGSITEIGQNDDDISVINVACTGKKTTSAARGYGIKGCGNVYLKNCNISITGEDISSAITCYGIYQSNGSVMSNGILDIQDKVKISIENNNKVNGVRAYGILFSMLKGGIFGNNVEIDINCSGAKSGYGIYLDNSYDFIIDPGTDVIVNVSGSPEGAFYPAYAKSRGKVWISDGKYLGGTLQNAVLTGGVYDHDPTAFVAEGYIAKANTPKEGLWTVEKDSRYSDMQRNVPRTGDNSQPIIWIILVIVAIAAIIIVILITRKKE